MENKKILYQITEEFLKNYSIENPPLISLYRDYHIQENYDNFRSSDNFFIFIDNIKELLEEKVSVLQLNDFPYYTTDNIKHYILWINNKKNPDKLDKLFIKNEINKYFNINIDAKNTQNTQNIKKRENIITYWVNTSQNTSIKDILHTHIFTKKIE